MKDGELALITGDEKSCTGERGDITGVDSNFISYVCLDFTLDIELITSLGTILAQKKHQNVVTITKLRYYQTFCSNSQYSLAIPQSRWDWVHIQEDLEYYQNKITYSLLIQKNNSH